MLEYLGIVIALVTLIVTAIGVFVGILGYRLSLRKNEEKPIVEKSIENLQVNESHPITETTHEAQEKIVENQSKILLYVGMGLCALGAAIMSHNKK